MRRAVVRKSELQKLEKEFDIKIGQSVSHEDYSDTIFTVTDISPDGVITTAGGKNGTWINHIDLIIKNPKR